MHMTNLTNPRHESSWDAAPDAMPARLVSAALEIAPVDPLAFLHGARGMERVSFAAPRGHRAFHGMGEAAQLFAYGEHRYSDIAQQARTLFDGAALPADAPEAALPALMGGFAFTDHFVPDHVWAAFQPAHFILPHVQLSMADGQCWLTANALIQRDEDPRETQQALHEALRERAAWLAVQPAIDTTAPASTAMRYPMTREAWRKMLLKALDQIRRGNLDKVVLARMCELRSEGEIEIEPALRRLNERFDGCYRFLFEPRAGHAFFGATPELLVGVHADQLDTMGLAGSVRAGNTPAETAAHAEKLLSSEKDLHEHALVVRMIRQRLAPHVSALHSLDKPGVMTLQNIQHLHTPIHATLREREGVLPWVERLHPTPALGGQPREEAMRFIEINEPVLRGWYGAPVGLIRPNLDGEFCVAIRSAVVQEDRAWLYAGCGVVADSQPDNEWDETALKFKAMLDALGNS
jgi:menaquinone-specific isochorismate synthase